MKKKFDPMTVNEISIAREVINGLYIGTSMEVVMRGLRRHCEAVRDASKCQEDGTAEQWDKLVKAITPLIGLADAADRR